MNRAFTKLFGPYLRVGPDGEASTADGRPLSFSSQGYQIAERLFETNAHDKADEIIKLMKPYCLRFDIATMRSSIIAAAQRQGQARKTVDATDLAQSTG